jgi:hypothetical protein
MDDIPDAAPDGTQCIHCGHALRGLRIDSNCPKCGTPIQRTLGSLPVSIPEAAICVRCAYALKGLSPSGVCPECGLPIERSLRGDLLVYSNPEYIRKLLLGSRLVLWSTLAIVLILIAQIDAAINRTAEFRNVLALCSLAANLAFLTGWWLLSSPDAGQLTTNKGQPPRRYVRFITATVLGFVALGAAAPFLQRWADPGLIRIVGLLAYPVMGAGFWAGMLYIRWLAPRIPDGRVHARAKALLVLLGSVILAVLIAIGIAVAGNDVGAAIVAAILILAVAISSIVALLMYCRMFYMLRSGLKAIVQAQREADNFGR